MPLTSMTRKGRTPRMGATLAGVIMQEKENKRHKGRERKK